MVKVRVIRKSESDNWYKINKIYDVIEETESHYMVSVISGILKEDAEVVEDVEKSCDTCRYGIIDDDCKLYPLPCNNNDGWQPIEVIAGVGQDAPKTGTTEEAKHYQVAEVQPIEIMQATMSKEQFEGYLLGNVIKYALRLNYKGQKVSDAGKCKQYAEWLQLAMNGGKIIPGGK